MRETCRTHERDEKCIKILFGKPERRILLRRQRRALENVIKMYLREIGFFF